MGIKQVLINIDEDKYEHICKKVRKAKNEDRYVHYEWEIIANGIVLPKGHGDLKDISKIDYQSGCFISSKGEPIPIIHKIATIEMIRDWLPTIIEADREVEE